MNRMDDKHQYHPYHRTNNSNNNLQQSYKDYHSYLSSTSSIQHAPINKKPSSNFLNQQSISDSYSYAPTRQLPPLISKKNGRSSPLFAAKPHERESWIRSVNRTKANESSEQKTQYLETMLRIPQQHQQKSSINSTTFDRIRFANDQTSSTVNIIDNSNILKENSFHLINNINNHDEIDAIETILLDNALESTNGTSSTQMINCETGLDMNSDPSGWAGFLIDNCDEAPSSSISPPSVPSMSSITEKTILQNQEQVIEDERASLVYEFDTVDAQRKRLNRQKRLRKKLQKRDRLKMTNTGQQASQLPSKSNVNNKNLEELSSDWIIEYKSNETDQISQLTTAVNEMTKTMTNEDKIEKINLILNKIKKQQFELRKLRKHVMSMLDEGQNSDTNQDILTTFINQPITSGCWLCSGKAYTEVATQCNNTN